jgi:hypothetical protein
MDVVKEAPPIEERVYPTPRAPNPVLEWLRSPAHLFVLFTCATLIGLVIWLIGAKGQNTPLQDEWLSSIDVAIKASAGELTFADLIQQNNEHRSFISHLSTAILTYTTGWNIKVGMYFHVGIALITLIFLIDLVRLHEPRAVALALMPLTAIIFSLRQHANWLMAFQIGWLAMVMFFVIALWALKRFRVGWLPLIIAAAMSHLMLFSLSHGIFGYILIPFAMFLLGYRKRRYYVFWLMAAAASLTVFFIGYNFDVVGIDHEGQGKGFAIKPTLIFYLLAYLGNPFVNAVDLKSYATGAAIMSSVGLMLIAVNVMFVWRRDGHLRNVAVWVALVGFSMGSALITGLGRGHVFPDLYPVQPLISRYVTAANGMWLAFTALALITIARVQAQPMEERTARAFILLWFNRLSFVIMAGLIIWTTQTSFGLPPRVSQSQADCVESFPVMRNMRCLARLYLVEQSVQEVTRLVDQLAIHQLATFADRGRLFSDITYLQDVPYSRQRDRPDIELQNYLIADDYVATVLYMHATGQAGFEVDVPQTDDHVYLLTAAFVDPSNIGDTTRPQDGVRFRVAAGVLGEAQGQLLADEIFDPHIHTTPLQMRVNLNAYRGQRIQIVFQTLERQTAFYDWSMWIDPRIIARDESF